MTDEQIIKALECCKTEGGCHECPLKNTDGACYTNMLLEREALDLINRQKVEIERLKTENNQFADIGKMYSEIKAEAIKEFVECLKATIDVDLSCGADSVHYLEDDLSNIMDDLVKEMTEPSLLDKKFGGDAE